MNQSLLSLLISMAKDFNRWLAMEGLSSILNKLIKSDPQHYRQFVYNHRGYLREFREELHNNPFNSEINAIL